MTNHENFELGKVSITFEERLEPLELGDDFPRYPVIKGQEIIFPDDSSIEVVKLDKSTECLVKSRSSQYLFGYGPVSVVWCGDRNGKPFQIRLSSGAANLCNDGDMQKWLEGLKPPRIRQSEKMHPLAKAELFDYFWAHQIREGLHNLRGFESALPMFHPRRTKLLRYWGVEITGELFEFGQYKSLWVVAKNSKIISRSKGKVSLPGVWIIQAARFVL